MIAFPVFPETKGVPLEEMDAVFGEGGYIDKSEIRYAHNSNRRAQR